MGDALAGCRVGSSWALRSCVYFLDDALKCLSGKLVEPQEFRTPSCDELSRLQHASINVSSARPGELQQLGMKEGSLKMNSDRFGVHHVPQMAAELSLLLPDLPPPPAAHCAAGLVGKYEF